MNNYVKSIKRHYTRLIESEGADSELVYEFSDTIAIALRGISINAHNSEDDFDTALEAIRLAVQAAKSTDLRANLKGDVSILETNFAEYQRGQVDLEIRGDRVVINREVVCYNSDRIPVSDVSGIRFGIFVQYTNGVQSSISYLIAVAGTHTQFEIECKRFWRSEEQAKADYTAILGGLYQNVIGKLAMKIAQSIESGHTFELGGCKLIRDGNLLKTGMLMWQKEHLVAWPDLRYGSQAGLLTISSASDRGLNISMAVRDVWNAIIFEPIFKTLTNLKSKNAPPSLPKK